jgi:hypothetical protein
VQSKNRIRAGVRPQNPLKRSMYPWWYRQPSNAATIAFTMSALGPASDRQFPLARHRHPVALRLGPAGVGKVIADVLMSRDDWPGHFQSSSLAGFGCARSPHQGRCRRESGNSLVFVAAATHDCRCVAFYRPSRLFSKVGSATGYQLCPSRTLTSIRSLRKIPIVAASRQQPDAA